MSDVSCIIYVPCVYVCRCAHDERRDATRGFPAATRYARDLQAEINVIVGDGVVESSSRVHISHTSSENSRLEFDAAGGIFPKRSSVTLKCPRNFLFHGARKFAEHLNGLMRIFFFFFLFSTNLKIQEKSIISDDRTFLF